MLAIDNYLFDGLSDKIKAMFPGRLIPEDTDLHVFDGRPFRADGHLAGYTCGTRARDGVVIADVDCGVRAWRV